MIDVCNLCKKPVYFAERIYAAGNLWHKRCFACSHCKKPLSASNACDHDGLPYCNNPCYKTLFGPRGYGSCTGLAIKKDI